jgi:diguanylate cyclase (GGDEF)-like protein
MLDLDHFKQLNDAYGHLAGDRVLRGVAEAINSSVRSYDATCRWGGEEFAVLLPEVDAAGLYAIAERIRRQVRSLVVDATTTAGLDAQISELTISIGGAIYPGPGITDLSALQLAADSALYAAKNNGRDRVHLAAPPGFDRLTESD